MNVIRTLSAALLIAASAIYASAEEQDTIMSLDKPDKVFLTESPDGITVNVRGLPGDSAFTTTYTHSFDTPTRINARRWNSFTPLSTSMDSRLDLTIAGPSIGWVNACGQPDGAGIEMGKSLEISWLNMLAVVYRCPWNTTSISVGFGLNWRNYRNSTSSSCFIPMPDGTVGLGHYAEGVTHTSSRLKVFSMGIPVLIRQRLPFKLFGMQSVITAGAVFNYNSHASLRTAWTEPDGEKAELTSNHIGQRRFTIDFIGILRLYGPLGAYVKYSPNSVLRGAGQMKFNPFSTGIILFY